MISRKSLLIDDLASNKLLRKPKMCNLWIILNKSNNFFYLRYCLFSNLDLLYKVYLNYLGKSYLQLGFNMNMGNIRGMHEISEPLRETVNHLMYPLYNG